MDEFGENYDGDRVSCTHSLKNEHSPLILMSYHEVVIAKGKLTFSLFLFLRV